MKNGVLISAFLLVTLTGWVSSGELYAQSVSDQTKRREEIEREIAFIDRQLSLTRTQQQTSTKELSFIQRKISNRRRLLSQLESEISQIDRQRVVKEREVEKLNSQLMSLRRDYTTMLYNSYKNRDKSLWMMYILASGSLEQGYRRWSYLRSMSDAMNRSAANIKQKGEELKIEIEALNRLRSESLEIQGRREREFRSLAQEERRSKEIISQLSRKEREFRTQLADKRREVERLNREIERILAEAARARKSSDFKESEAERVLADNFESNRGRLPWPVKEGVIIEQFGQHTHPVFKNIKLPFNNGVNISTAAGAEVYSVFEGVVKQILFMPGYNQCVLVQHGTFYTFYTKLDKVAVKSGDKISTAQLIGNLTVNEGSSVLHFQLWSGTTKQNPEHWISK